MGEESTEFSAELLKAVLDTVVDGIITINDRGIILSLNPAALKIFGYSEAELIGRNVSVLMPSPYREEHDGYIDNYHRTGRAKIIGIGREAEGQRKDGSTFPLYLAVSKFEYDGKRYYSGLVRDITEVKRYREHLEELVESRTRQLEEAHEQLMRRTEETFQAVLNSASDAVLICRPDESIIFANPAAERLFGYPEAQLLKMKLEAIFPATGEIDGIETRFRPHEALADTSHDAIAHHRDGSHIPVDLAVSRMADQSYTVIIRDMSQRRQLQREVLQSAEEERRRIGGDLHDALGQHMTGIAYLAETLQKQVGDQDPEAARLAGRIAELLKETIEQTRRLVRGLYPVEPRPDGLRDALTSLVKRLEEDFHIEAVFECPEDFVFSDSNAANHLYRIAQEASSNAVRHGGASSVRIRIALDDHWTHLVIADDGEGFASDESPAAGLGLRLMRYRAGLIGGQLTVRSEPGKGTRVVCTLPRLNGDG